MRFLQKYISNSNFSASSLKNQNWKKNQVAQWLTCSPTNLKTLVRPPLGSKIFFYLLFHIKTNKFQYVKRRCPLLGYLFENEETKEYDVGDVEFEDLVDIFGIFQNRWELEGKKLIKNFKKNPKNQKKKFSNFFYFQKNPKFFSADRMIHLIPIARKFGFDIWGKSLNREFSQLMHRLDPVEIVAEPNEEPVKFEFNTTLKWAIDDFELIGPSTLPKNQNLMVTWEEQNRNWWGGREIQIFLENLGLNFFVFKFGTFLFKNLNSPQHFWNNDTHIDYVLSKWNFRAEIGRNSPE